MHRCHIPNEGLKETELPQELADPLTDLESISLHQPPWTQILQPIPTRDVAQSQVGGRHLHWCSLDCIM